MWSISNNTEDIGRWREVSWGKSEGETNHERLWTLRNKLRVSEGKGMDGWVGPVMGIKAGMYCMEHWVLYANSESWNTTPKTNDVLYGD